MLPVSVGRLYLTKSQNKPRKLNRMEKCEIEPLKHNTKLKQQLN